jgi:hypothetical protein
MVIVQLSSKLIFGSQNQEMNKLLATDDKVVDRLANHSDEGVLR